MIYKNIPSRSEIQDTILSYAADVLAYDLVEDQTNAKKTFASLGIDSVTVFQLQMKLENHYTLSLSGEFLFEYPTAEDASLAIFEILEASSQDASSSAQ